MLRPYLLLNKNLPESMISSLSEDFRPVRLPEFHALPFPVSCHPDMLVFRKGDRLITDRRYFEQNRALFESFEGYGTVTAPELTGEKYPDDILLNALALGDTLFHKKGCVSKAVHDLFGRSIFVSQGYAACSTCRVSDSAVITADPSIFSAALENGIDALKIEPGHIGLETYGTGFIGGASFADSARVYFFGDLSSHPDSDKIRNFIESHNKECVSLSGGALHDYGGAVPL